MKYRDQKLTLDYLLEIWKKIAHEEAGEPEPEPKDRTMTDTKRP
jgi:hypothetical protein